MIIKSIFNASSFSPAAASIGKSSGGVSLSPRQLLDQAINDSRSQAAAAVGSSQSGVSAILGQSGNVKQGIAAMRDSAAEMRPIADKLQSYGDELWAEGSRIMDDALDVLDTGMGFINMDADSSPLVAEALKLYGEFDPDRYVAGAAQDVQSQADNARGQSERQLARMGVNPTSGVYAALKGQLQRSLATAKAAAMTRARERGKTDAATMFQSLIADNANKFLSQGGSLAGQGAAIKGQGANAQTGAASVLADIAGVEGDAATLGLNFGNALQDAYQALANTKLQQADNTRATEALRVSALTSGGGGGGVTVTQAPKDDWMNWMGTGHSQTWNKNHNPNFNELLMLAAS